MVATVDDVVAADVADEAWMSKSDAEASLAVASELRRARARCLARLSLRCQADERSVLEEASTISNGSRGGQGRRGCAAYTRSAL
eukprot:3032684-Alexandrium_andersonii.AAC.1